MSYKDVFKRAAATFVAGMAAAPLVAAGFGLASITAILIAGLISLVNLVGRLAQRWLDEHPEGESEKADEVGAALEKALRNVLPEHMQAPR